MPITEPIDEDELETELAALEQEKLDEDMLKTGTMPVMSPVNGLPNGPTGESEFFFFLLLFLPPPQIFFFSISARVHNHETFTIHHFRPCFPPYLP